MNEYNFEIFELWTDYGQVITSDNTINEFFIN